MKTTDELLNEILNSNEINTFLDKNDEAITSLTLSQYVDLLLKQKHIAKKETIHNAQLNYTYGHQIINGTRNPSRDKIIQLCFGMKASLDEANRLLTISDCGRLYTKNRRDCVIIFALNKGINLLEANDLLYELGEKCFDL